MAGGREWALQLLRGRWMVVVASFYILSFAGATYIFGIYSGAIKQALNYDQKTIDTLGFFKDLGANVGLVSGLISEVVPTWVVLGVGAAMNLVGYLMIWMAVTHRVGRPRQWHMYLYMCMGANSQTFANTAVLVTCVKNFPASRGVVLGLVKGFVGLSGAIFTQVYHAIYGQDTRGVIFLVGWLPSLVSLLFMVFIRPMKPQMDTREKKHFFTFLYLSLLLAAFLMLIIIVETRMPLSSATYKAMGVLTLLLVASNIFVAVRAELEKARDLDDNHQSNKAPKQVAKSSSTSDCDPMNYIGNSLSELEMTIKEPRTSPNDKEVPSPPPTGQLQKQADDETLVNPTTQLEEDLVNENAKDLMGTAYSQSQINHASASADAADTSRGNWNVGIMGKVMRSVGNWPERGDDFTIPQALLSLDMWILFISTTCGVGSTLTAIDNMGQIGAALGYSDVSISTCVALISIWNFLGRVGAGFASEALLQKYRFPRTLVLTIVMAVACSGHLLIALPTKGSLYIASIIVGLCFGAQWPVLYAVISELFGLKYYATLYNFGAVASPLGSYLFNVRVAGYLYDKEALRQFHMLHQVQDGAFTQHQHLRHLSHAASSASANALVCLGPQCFKATFLIMALVSALGSLVSVVLVLRTRKFYSQDIYAKFRPAT